MHVFPSMNGEQIEVMLRDGRKLQAKPGQGRSRMPAPGAAAAPPLSPTAAMQEYLQLGASMNTTEVLGCEFRVKGVAGLSDPETMYKVRAHRVELDFRSASSSSLHIESSDMCSDLFFGGSHIARSGCSTLDIFSIPHALISRVRHDDRPVQVTCEAYTRV